MTIIRVENLSVHVGSRTLVAPVSFALGEGERLTILGQTGSGKSLLAQAIMGNLPDSLASRGHAWLFGSETPARSRRQWWGRQLSMLPQEPWNALNPLMTSVNQLAETYRFVCGRGAPEARQQAQQTLAEIGLEASAEKRVDQLSGGMAQRVAIACAMAGGAPLLLADEPTKGLDVSRRDQVVRQLLVQSAKGALLTITHDVEVAKQIGGQLMVVKEGQIVEQGRCETVLSSPQHTFTRELMAADPSQWPDRPAQQIDQSPVIEARGLSVGHGKRALLQDLSLTVHAGEVIGVVGDSGCGKSTLGDTLLGLRAPLAGQVTRLKQTPAHRWQKLYQDPTAAVSQAVTLRVLLQDVVAKYRVSSGVVKSWMTRLALTDELLDRKADGVSGGELQRFCILRAMILDPVFLFADEPTSRLDPMTARDVTHWLVNIARETQCAVMLVSHHPELIEKSCDRVISLDRRLCGAYGEIATDQLVMG
ncbi:ABC transporter ATP-binding protein [Marinobacter sp. GN3S48]|uniref:ABC transporter ATP-binding protein n=1 Tax=Marinobacter sp. GN3S48 TaxID=3382302 RepID=UPI00387A9267